MESISVSARTLRSAGGNLLTVASIKADMTEGFPRAAPILWNSLPLSNRNANFFFNAFKRMLKTHLFSRAM